MERRRAVSTHGFGRDSSFFGSDNSFQDFAPVASAPPRAPASVLLSPPDYAEARASAPNYAEAREGPIPSAPQDFGQSSRGKFLKWALSIAIAGGLACAFLYRKELASTFSALAALFRSSIPPLPAAHDIDASTDLVDVSAFAPATAAVGETILVQVFFRHPDRATIAQVLANEADPDTKRRGIATLLTQFAQVNGLTSF